MDFLNQILAGLLNKFKTSSPNVYAIIILLVIGLNVLLTNESFLALIPEGNEWVTTLAKWISIAYGFLLSSPTFGFLSAKKKADVLESFPTDQKQEMTTALLIDKQKS